jgi:hypothetical protein
MTEQSSEARRTSSWRPPVARNSVCHVLAASMLCLFAVGPRSAHADVVPFDDDDCAKGHREGQSCGGGAGVCEPSKCLGADPDRPKGGRKEVPCLKCVPYRYSKIPGKPGPAESANAAGSSCAIAYRHTTPSWPITIAPILSLVVFWRRRLLSNKPLKLTVGRGRPPAA